MTCNDVRMLLPDLALGDLDAEPAALVETHVRTCAACRTESDALRRTIGVLKSAPVPAPSTVRRTATVAAMESARRAVSRPRSWAPWATAAAFLLAVLAAISLRVEPVAFTVAKVTGRAKLLDRQSGEWRPVSAGALVSVGDHLITERGCLLRLSGGSTAVCLDEDSSLSVVAPRRVTLDRGRLLAVAPESGSELLIVTDTANNSATVTGRVELALRDVSAHLAGSVEERGSEPVLPKSKVQVQRSLVARVQSGETALGGARDQRLRASAGQEGTFSFGGQPSTSRVAEGAVGAWADPGFEQ